MGLRNRTSYSQPRSSQEPESLIDILYSDNRQGFENLSPCRSQSPPLLLFSDTQSEIPEMLRAAVLKADLRAIVKRNWDSVLDDLNAYSVIVDCSENMDAMLRRIDDLWRRKVRANYAVRPAYLVVGTITRYPLARFEIEFRRGAHFLHLHDVPTQFGCELEQIRLRQRDLERSSLRWFIEYEGNGCTLRVNVSFVSPRGLRVVRMADSHAAELAVFITNNRIHRPIAGWRKIMLSNPLFKPLGGGFRVPTRTTLKTHLNRDYVRDIQRAFDEGRTGFSAERAIERVGFGDRTVGYRIRGKWEAIRR